MEYVAMELFELNEVEILRGQLRTIEKSVDNLRRGIFVRHDELSKKLIQFSECFERLTGIVNLLEERQKYYEAALFPVDSVGDKVSPTSGLKSISAPVSFCMTSSHTSSTGLSLPRK